MPPVDGELDTNDTDSGVTDAAVTDQADSSTDDAAPAQQSDQVDAPAGDAPAKENDDTVDKKTGEDNMLGRVMKSLGLKKDPVEKKDAASKTAATGDKAAPAKTDDASADNKTAAPADAEQAPPEIANHPAYKKMQTEHAETTAMAKSYMAVNTYMQENGISSQEFGDTFKLLALRNSNPEEFYNQASAIVQEFGVMLGKTLPADLQKEVDDGVLTSERASEMAKLRVEKKVAENKATTATSAVHASQTAQQKQSREQTVNAWFAKTAKTDPDLESKVDLIEGEMLRLMRVQGAPADSKGQMALLDMAHKNVSNKFKAAAPKKPVNAPPRSNSAARAGAPAKPAGMLGIVENIMINGTNS